MAWWGKKKKNNLQDDESKDFSVRFENSNGMPFVSPIKNDMAYFKAEEELNRQKEANSVFSDFFGVTENKREAVKNEEKPKSVAKIYGTKYVSDGVQLASSKVVDVRSYKKEVSLPPPIPKAPEVVNEEAPKRRSFFDDLLKELEEDESEEKAKEEVKESKKEIKEPESKKKKVPKSAVSHKKKSIDIDIISGDFGGSDIL